MLERLVCPYPWPVNAHYEDGLLIDAGYPWSMAALRRGLAGRPVRRILLTHAHPDHVGCASTLARETGATLVAHRQDVPFLTGQASLGSAPAWWLAALVHRPLGVWNLGPVEAVDEGHREGPWTVLHTPGHTPGHLALWDPERRTLLVGDLLVHAFGRVAPGVPWFTLDLEERARSLRRLADLPARRLAFGHGPPWIGDVPGLLARLLAKA